MSGAALRASALLQEPQPELRRLRRVLVRAAARSEEGRARKQSESEEGDGAARDGKLVADKLPLDHRPQRRRELHAQGPAAGRRGRARSTPRSASTIRTARCRPWPPGSTSGRARWCSACAPARGRATAAAPSSPCSRSTPRASRSRARASPSRAASARSSPPASAWSAASTPTTTAPRSRSSAALLLGHDRRRAACCSATRRSTPPARSS